MKVKVFYTPNILGPTHHMFSALHSEPGPQDEQYRLAAVLSKQ